MADEYFYGKSFINIFFSWISIGCTELDRIELYPMWKHRWASPLHNVFFFFQSAYTCVIHIGRVQFEIRFGGKIYAQFLVDCLLILCSSSIANHIHYWLLFSIRQVYLWIRLVRPSHGTVLAPQKMSNQPIINCKFAKFCSVIPPKRTNTMWFR